MPSTLNCTLQTCRISRDYKFYVISGWMFYFATHLICHFSALMKICDFRMVNVHCCIVHQAETGWTFYRKSNKRHIITTTLWLGTVSEFCPNKKHQRICSIYLLAACGSHSQDLTYYSHKPECIMTTNPDRSVLITIITWHFQFRPVNVSHLHLRYEYRARSKSRFAWRCARNALHHAFHIGVYKFVKRFLLQLNILTKNLQI